MMELPLKEAEVLIETLRSRFEKNRARHENIEWAPVQAALMANVTKLQSLHEMEKTGGEPDVVGYDRATGEYIFMIALLRALLAAEVFVMIWRGLNQERKIGRITTL